MLATCRGLWASRETFGAHCRKQAWSSNEARPEGQKHRSALNCAPAPSEPR